MIAGGIAGNPQGGLKGGLPVWSDGPGGDGVRGDSENDLNDEDSTNEVGWHVNQVIVSGVTYYVDSRDHLIDFDRVTGSSAVPLLAEPPESASADNCSISECDGSYIWYVDQNGIVETLLSDFPSATSTGFQEIYP